MRVGGIVLCGGRSQRMGRPKAWLPFGGEPLLARVVRRLGEAADPVVVVAAPGQDLPPLPPAVSVARDPEEGRGPLQGFAVGLAALAGQVDFAFLASCDSPFLSPALLRRLADLLGPALACAPAAGAYRQPLAALYRLEVAPTVARLLSEGRQRVLDLFDAVPTRVVTEAELADVDPGLRSLRNVNTPEEYEAALREEAAGCTGPG
jgi:molybdopterin-guanine dinucleotide biosynthesis protein A